MSNFVVGNKAYLECKIVQQLNPEMVLVSIDGKNVFPIWGNRLLSKEDITFPKKDTVVLDAQEYKNGRYR